MRKVKAFYAPDGVEEYFGFFSIKEDANFFYGYKMSKEPGTYSIILQHGTRKNPDDIYIICDYMCKISKSIRLNRMILDYDTHLCRSPQRCESAHHLPFAYLLFPNLCYSRIVRAKSGVYLTFPGHPARC